MDTWDRNESAVLFKATGMTGELCLTKDHLAALEAAVSKEVARERQALMPLIEGQEEQIAALEAAMKEKDEVIENWKREHNRLIDVDCEKILALNADNEILRNMNKILLDSGGALTAERDGYRNGQAQVQSIADGLMDTVEKYAKERAVLTAENAELTKICLAGEPPYYTKWKEVTAENQGLRKEMINLYNCRYEPDKMLCLVERWKQALKQTVSPEEPDAAWKLGLKLHQNEQTEGGGRC
jgi:hypothetical protein